MLSVSKLSIDYGSNRVVSELDLALDKSEILMLVGPTGCGKSTILQALAGLIPISEGQIDVGKWRATPTQTVPPEKRSVGPTSHNPSPWPGIRRRKGFLKQNDSPSPCWGFLV